MTMKLNEPKDEAQRILLDVYEAFGTMHYLDSPEVLAFKSQLYDRFADRIRALVGTYDDDPQ